MNPRTIRGLPVEVLKPGTRVVDAVSGVAHVMGSDSIIIAPTKVYVTSISEARVRHLFDQDTGHLNPPRSGR